MSTGGRSLHPAVFRLFIKLCVEVRGGSASSRQVMLVALRRLVLTDGMCLATVDVLESPEGFGNEHEPI